MFILNGQPNLLSQKYFFLYNNTPGNGGVYSNTGNPVPAFPIFLSLFNFNVPANGYKFVAVDDFIRRANEIQTDAQPRVCKSDGTPEATGINELAYWVNKNCIKFYNAITPASESLTPNADGSYTLPWNTSPSPKIVYPKTSNGLIPGPSFNGNYTASFDANFSNQISAAYTPLSTQATDYAYDGNLACYISLIIE